LIVLAYVLGFPWVWMVWDWIPREGRRRLAIIYLDGLLVGYALAMSVAVVTIGVVILLRMRSGDTPARRRRQARLLALGVSVLLSLILLDSGAAAWSTWLHRVPQLPAIGGGGTAHKEPGLPDPSKTGVDPDLPRRFPARPAGSGAGALRILVIGESSARGEPYNPWLSVGQIVAWKLEQVLRGRPVQVDTWAVGGASLAQMHNRLAGLTYRPDALIVYVGHNEFQARYPWMRDVGHYLDELPSLYSPESLTTVLRRSPLCRLVLETWERQRVDMRPPRLVTRELVDVPVCTADEADRILAEFAHRLDAIASYCTTIRTLPIFIIPASNDGSYDPSRSVLAPGTPKAERVAFARSVARARVLEKNDPPAALRLDRELVERHPEFAETHYRLARLLEQTGDWVGAREHYIQARERDGLPLRCPEAFRRAYREVAARHPAVLLVDGPKVLEARSLHGIPDDRLFHDAQHPNLLGYVALAQDLLDQLHQRRAWGWPEGAEVPHLDADACARHFGLGAQQWEVVCSRVAEFYHITAYVRYDPKFRNERAVAYRRAGAALQAGRSAAEAGIPGWGMLPRPTLSSHVIPAIGTLGEEDPHRYAAAWIP
jgi:hypothetical protein